MHAGPFFAKDRLWFSCAIMTSMENMAWAVLPHPKTHLPVSRQWLTLTQRSHSQSVSHRHTHLHTYKWFNPYHNTKSCWAIWLSSSLFLPKLAIKPPQAPTHTLLASPTSTRFFPTLSALYECSWLLRNQVPCLSLWNMNTSAKGMGVFTHDWIW